MWLIGRAVRSHCSQVASPTSSSIEVCRGLGSSHRPLETSIKLGIMFPIALPRLGSTCLSMSTRVCRHRPLARGIAAVWLTRRSHLARPPQLRSASRHFAKRFNAYWVLQGPRMASERNRKLWVSMMERHVMPAIGARPVVDRHETPPLAERLFGLVF